MEQGDFFVQFMDIAEGKGFDVVGPVSVCSPAQVPEQRLGQGSHRRTLAAEQNSVSSK